MKTLLMYTVVISYIFILWVGIFILFLIFFIPILPILVIAFPMMFLDDTHWSCRPYMWYFNNVWLNVLKFFKIKIKITLWNSKQEKK